MIADLASIPMADTGIPITNGIIPILGLLVMHLVISIINTFKSFKEAYILCGDYPHKSIYMIQHFMNNNFQNLNYTRLSVGSILVFIIIFIIILLLFKFKKRLGDIEYG